jgi:hypothetical protein
MSAPTVEENPVTGKAELGFQELVGSDIFEFIAESAPAQVTARIAKSEDHFRKSQRLVGVDEEMGAIRLIAAEEELVVAIFECLKQRAELFPEHADFVKQFKRHPVKLSFYPVLQTFRWSLHHLFADGFTLEGLEDVIDWRIRPVVRDRKVMLLIHSGKGEEILSTAPFTFSVSMSGKTDEDVINELYADFEKEIKKQGKVSVHQFIIDRAEYRNRLLYANDDGYVEMEETLEQLLEIFRRSLHDLLWVVALLLGDPPPSKKWGIVAQFIAVYRKVLQAK